MFLSTFLKYNKDSKSDNCEIITTKILVKDIEKCLNNNLDKHDKICKYYIDIENSCYVVSFNVGFDQINEMTATMFQINIFENMNANAVITISKEIKGHEQWRSIYTDLLRDLNN